MRHAAVVGCLLLVGCAGRNTKSDDLVTVPFEVGRAEFASGDEVRVEDVQGTHPRFVVGGTYQVRGSYRLRSRDRALLGLWSTNGETQGKKEKVVERGSGEFDFSFTIIALGYPNVGFCPAEGGECFGDVYFGTGDSVRR